jgi:hypothetical protein
VRQDDLLRARREIDDRQVAVGEERDMARERQRREHERSQGHGHGR